MILTPKERMQVYNHLEYVYDTDVRPGCMCYHIYHYFILEHSYVVKEDQDGDAEIKLLPELYELKPEDTWNEMFWFEPKDRMSRYNLIIKAQKKCLSLIQEASTLSLTEPTTL